MTTHLPPLQYYRFNKVGRAVVDEYAKVHGNEPPSKKTWPTVERMLKQFFPTQGRLSREQSVELFTEFTTIRDYLSWWTAGKNVFLFTDQLVSAFLRTDVDDIPASLLKPPYRAFYFKFGNRTDIQTIASPLRYLDGAYIFEQPQGLSVIYTQCSADCVVGSTGLGFCINFFGANTVGEALERGLSMQAQHISDAANDAAAYGDCVGFMRDTEEQRRAVFEHGLPIYREITKLVVNGLAFALYEKDFISDDWLGAPEGMVRKLQNSGTEKEMRRNESKLLALGFSKVRLCSPHIESADENASTGPEVQPHWRRGHWRRQPHGPGLSLIRLVWIRPTIVRRDRGEPEEGHIYHA